MLLPHGNLAQIAGIAYAIDVTSVLPTNSRRRARGMLVPVPGGGGAGAQQHVQDPLSRRVLPSP